MRDGETILARLISLTSSSRRLRRQFLDLDEETLAIIERVRRYTLTTPPRIAAICNAVRYAEANGIPGDFVECGVWKGGSAMAAALSFATPRPIHLFDTYEGMTAPTEADVRRTDGRGAVELLEAAPKSAGIWCVVSCEEVVANMRSTGYPGDKVICVEGRVEETIPSRAPDRISVLHLDTDWYESTKHELEHLYPRLSPGGILIIDDYGRWAGARKAVDEYFRGTVFLHRIDDTAVALTKPAAEHDRGIQDRASTESSRRVLN